MNPYPTISSGSDTGGLGDTAKEYLASYAKQPTLTKVALGAGAGYLVSRLLAKKHTTAGLLIGGALGAVIKAR
jgi:hypothetical protein